MRPVVEGKRHAVAGIRISLNEPGAFGVGAVLRFAQLVKRAEPVARFLYCRKQSVHYGGVRRRGRMEQQYHSVVEV